VLGTGSTGALALGFGGVDVASEEPKIGGKLALGAGPNDAVAATLALGSGGKIGSSTVGAALHATPPQVTRPAPAVNTRGDQMAFKICLMGSPFFISCAAPNGLIARFSCRRQGTGQMPVAAFPRAHF
jgi:hypothetical protein